MNFDIDSIKKSYDRCLNSHGNNKKFFVRFYEVFLESDPEIRSMFLQTNIMKQVNALKNGISTVIMYAGNDDSMTSQGLESIRRTHSSDTLKVKARHYKIWEDSLITVLYEYDNEFTEILEKDWRALIQQTVDILLVE